MLVIPLGTNIKAHVARWILASLLRVVRAEGIPATGVTCCSAGRYVGYGQRLWELRVEKGLQLWSR